MPRTDYTGRSWPRYTVPLSFPTEAYTTMLSGNIAIDDRVQYRRYAVNGPVLSFAHIPAVTFSILGLVA